MSQVSPVTPTRIAVYRVSLLAGKSKVMIVGSDGKMIVNSGKRPCCVWGKGVQANTVKCTVCKRWIHKRFSGVGDNLSLVKDSLDVSDETVQFKKLI